jgi:hypothetical protein
VEGIFDGALIQPHIHDIFLIIAVKRRRVLFRMFFKRHKNLPHNPFLGIQGDLLVMRVASHNRNSLVNLRSSDIHTLDRSLARFALLLPSCTPAT